MVHLYDIGFETAINPSWDITNVSLSKYGVIIVKSDESFGAICGNCRYILGWTFAPDGTSFNDGFWSCLYGCKKKYANELGSQTSSITNLEDPGRDINEWFGGWLGIDKDKIKVEIK